MHITLPEKSIIFCLAEFFVAVLPKASINSNSLTISQGGKKLIKCSGSGYPFPNISWFRNAKKINSVITQNGIAVSASLSLTGVSVNLYKNKKITTIA